MNHQDKYDLLVISGGKRQLIRLISANTRGKIWRKSQIYIQLPWKKI